MNKRYGFSMLIIASLGTVLMGACGVAQGDDGDDADTLNEAASAVPQCTMDTTVSLEAGPIDNETQAKFICPAVCFANQLLWNEQWTTTVKDKMSVCGCTSPPHGDVKAKGINFGSQARERCPSVCEAKQRKWDGTWAPAVLGGAPTCGCYTPAPRALSLEAGPIGGNAEAGSRCPAVCGKGRHWDGNWSTTVPDYMSVCNCVCNP